MGRHSGWPHLSDDRHVHVHVHVHACVCVHVHVMCMSCACACACCMLHVACCTVCACACAWHAHTLVYELGCHISVITGGLERSRTTSSIVLTVLGPTLPPAASVSLLCLVEAPPLALNMRYLLLSRSTERILISFLTSRTCSWVRAGGGDWGWGAEIGQGRGCGCGCGCG